MIVECILHALLRAFRRPSSSIASTKESEQQQQVLATANGVV
jgi:hypothetical protein